MSRRRIVVATHTTGADSACGSDKRRGADFRRPRDEYVWRSALATDNWHTRVKIHALNLDIECLRVANQRYKGRYDKDIKVLVDRRDELIRRLTEPRSDKP